MFFPFLERRGAVAVSKNFKQSVNPREIPEKGKSENGRINTGGFMVGLGGLEPPTSPLSGAFYGAICIVRARVCSLLTRASDTTLSFSVAIPCCPKSARRGG
jgi:hypothetical protein